MPKDVARAYGSYLHQRNRCYNPNSNGYKWYGAKGIKVEYSSHEFVGWWLANFYSKKWVKPSVGRIDHSKNYSFDNIEMQEIRDNVLEENARLGHTGTRKKSVVLLDSKGNPAIIFPTLTGAQKMLGLGNLTKVCNKKYKHEHGFVFRWYDEVFP